MESANPFDDVWFVGVEDSTHDDADRVFTPVVSMLVSSLSYLPWKPSLGGSLVSIARYEILAALGPAFGAFFDEEDAAFFKPNILTHDISATKLSAITVFLARAGLFNAVYSSQQEFEAALVRIIPTFKGISTLELKAKSFAKRENPTRDEGTSA